MNTLLLGASSGGFPIALSVYAGVALLYLGIWRAAATFVATPGNSRISKISLAVALLLLALGVDKEFHLSEQLIDTFRQRAKANGWYDERRVVQTWVIFGVLFGGFLGAGLATYRLSRKAGSNMPLFVALTYLLIFKVVQACSLHQIDAILRTQLGFLSVARWIEMTLLTLIALIGVRQWVRIRKQGRAP